MQNKNRHQWKTTIPQTLVKTQEVVDEHDTQGTIASMEFDNRQYTTAIITSK